MSTNPRIGDPVHYVSFGTPGGEYASQCRAAIVAGVPRGVLPNFLSHDQREWDSDVAVLDLMVANPTGLFFNRVPQDEDHHRGGTWHLRDGCDS